MSTDAKFDPSQLEVLQYIKGDPNCSRCYGRGYNGITTGGVIHPCRCHVIVSPAMDKVLKNQLQLAADFKEMDEQLTADLKALSEKIDMAAAVRKEFATGILEAIYTVESRFIRTRVVNFFRRFRRGHTWKFKSGASITFYPDEEPKR